METIVTPKAPRKEKPYTMSRVFRHLFSGKDNHTIDIGRVIWFSGAMSFIVISGFYVWKTKQWNPLEWGAGFAALNGGSGAALKLKENTEPVI